MTDNIYDELHWRGLIYDATEGTEELLRKEKVTIYIGFDPTGESLHVGHLIPMIALARFQRFGHTPIAVAGGGTAMVGDPSGRSEERNLLSPEEIEANLVGIKEQLAHFLDFDAANNPAYLVNNADWLAHLNLLDFLRDVGKHFTVNRMAAKESVKSRLERESGLSFTEFSYMLLQAFDFLQLYEQYGCHLQAGGSDQWGNIVAGTDLIRRMHGERAFGLVYPLLTQDDGSKFGKTATGTSVWLDPQKTSPYRFYQFWFNAEDADVINYLKIFTFLDREAIETLAHKVETEPHLREAQRRLAVEITRMVHGPEGLATAQQASEVLFGGDLTGLDAGEIADIFSDVPSSGVSAASLEDGGLPVIDLVAESSLASSRGDAKRAIRGGGIYLNNERVEELSRRATVADAIEGQFLILRKGKRRYHLLRVQH